MADPAVNPDLQVPAPEAAGEETQGVDALVSALGVSLAEESAAARAAIEALAREVLALRAERTALQARLDAAESLADRDPLCPVFNRRAFERELGREIALAERHGAPLCLVYIDLDRFKLVNDRFGHARGDKVICEVALTLQNNVRQTDILGRLGGDEFAIVLTHAERADCEAKAAALEAAIDAITINDDAGRGRAAVQLGASCGVVEWRKGDTPARLIDAADEAMFRTKAKRRRAR